MLHYARLLRREVVSDSEIAELCRRIYHRHKRALDLIFDHRPSLQDDLAPLLAALVEAEPDLVLDGAARSSVRFGHRRWETEPLKSGEGWSPAGRILLFTFDNRPDRLELNLYVGPGPADVRRRLIDVARAHPPLFSVAKRATPKWTRLFRRTVLRPADYEETTFDEVEPRVRERWASFLATDLPVIAEAMRIDGLTL
jgi:hypothetical protein